MADSDSIAFKQCALCRATREIREFHRDRTVPDGFCNGCKDCKRSQRARLMAARGDEVRKKDRDMKRGNEAYINRKRAARYADVERARKYQRDYHKANPEKRVAYRKAHESRHGVELLIKARAWNKERRETNPVYRLSCSVRKRLREFMIRRNFTKSAKTLDMLGCSWPEFANHIGSKFAPGMKFENYGEWHLDHIIPLASAKNESDVIRLSHYTNLQPLWAADNRRKSASLPSEA